MFSWMYQSYKLWFWFVVFVAFISGTVYKWFYAPMWQVWLNAGCGLISLVIFVILLMRKIIKHKVKQKIDI